MLKEVRANNLDVYRGAESLDCCFKTYQSFMYVGLLASRECTRGQCHEHTSVHVSETPPSSARMVDLWYLFLSQSEEWRSDLTTGPM